MGDSPGMLPAMQTVLSLAILGRVSLISVQLDAVSTSISCEGICRQCDFRFDLFFSFSFSCSF